MKIWMECGWLLSISLKTPQANLLPSRNREALALCTSCHSLYFLKAIMIKNEGSWPVPQKPEWNVSAFQAFHQTSPGVFSTKYCTNASFQPSHQGRVELAKTTSLHERHTFWVPALQLQAVWSWTKFVTSLGLLFLICNKVIFIFYSSNEYYIG